ncbi:hypothetical protein L195_g003667, partial [Trifolium pratense]
MKIGFTVEKMKKTGTEKEEE